MQVQGTINGIGERCGNADLVSVIANLASRSRATTVLRPAASSGSPSFRATSTKSANMNFRQPAVRRASAFAHKGGMHVHAIARRDAKLRTHRPEKVGNERRILVSELSGRSNIVALTSDTICKTTRN